jgi:hypothetical protein
VRGDLRDVERNIFNYSVATGMFFTDDEAYVVEIYESGKTDEFSVVLTGSQETLGDEVYNQPTLNGSGVNESLSMTSEKAELPDTDEELEAFARYVLQEGPDEGLQYSGPRGPDELDF